MKKEIFWAVIIASILLFSAAIITTNIKTKGNRFSSLVTKDGAVIETDKQTGDTWFIFGREKTLLGKREGTKSASGSRDKLVDINTKDIFSKVSVRHASAKDPEYIKIETYNGSPFTLIEIELNVSFHTLKSFLKEEDQNDPKNWNCDRQYFIDLPSPIPSHGSGVTEVRIGPLPFDFPIVKEWELLSAKGGE